MSADDREETSSSGEEEEESSEYESESSESYASGDEEGESSEASSSSWESTEESSSDDDEAKPKDSKTLTFEERHARAIQKWGLKDEEKDDTKGKQRVRQHRLKKAKVDVKEEDEEDFSHDTQVTVPVILGQCYEIENMGVKKSKDVGSFRRILGMFMERCRVLLEDAPGDRETTGCLVFATQLLSSFYLCGIAGSTSPPTLTDWSTSVKHLNDAIDLLVLDPELSIPDGRGGDKVLVDTMRTAVISTDAELARALQRVSYSSQEYRHWLALLPSCVALLYRTYLLSDAVLHQGILAFKLLDRIYYLEPTVCRGFWDIVLQKAPEITVQTCEEAFSILEKSALAAATGPETSSLTPPESAMMTRLHRVFFDAVHLKYKETAEAFAWISPQELLNQFPDAIKLHVTYNRVLVQFGICAFSTGHIREAYGLLTEISAPNRLRELLAQVKHQDRRHESGDDRKRLLPPHLHFSLDVVDGVYNICAMLIEAVSIATTAAYDKQPDERKHVSRFRRLLDAHDRSGADTAPDSSRDTVLVATKAMQRGDDEYCLSLLRGLEFWESFSDPETILKNLEQCVRLEVMRIYLLKNKGRYRSITQAVLSEKFKLPPEVVYKDVTRLMTTQQSFTGRWSRLDSNLTLVFEDLFAH